MDPVYGKQLYGTVQWEYFGTVGAQCSRFVRRAALATGNWWNVVGRGTVNVMLTHDHLRENGQRGAARRRSIDQRCDLAGLTAIKKSIYRVISYRT